MWGSSRPGRCYPSSAVRRLGLVVVGALWLSGCVAETSVAQRGGATSTACGEVVTVSVDAAVTLEDLVATGDGAILSWTDATEGRLARLGPEGAVDEQTALGLRARFLKARVAPAGSALDVVLHNHFQRGQWQVFHQRLDGLDGWSWETARQLSTEPTEAQDARIAVGPSGRGVVYRQANATGFALLSPDGEALVGSSLLEPAAPIPQTTDLRADGPTFLAFIRRNRTFDLERFGADGAHAGQVLTVRAEAARLLAGDPPVIARSSEDGLMLETVVSGALVPLDAIATDAPVAELAGAGRSVLATVDQAGEAALWVEGADGYRSEPVASNASRIEVVEVSGRVLAAWIETTPDGEALRVQRHCP